MKASLKEKLESYIVASYTDNKTKKKELGTLDNITNQQLQQNKLNVNMYEQLETLRNK